MDRAELVELVWQHASEDAALFQKLRLLAATAAGPDLGELSCEVRRLRVEWIEPGGERVYANGAREVLQALDRLVPKHAATVQPLLRRAVAHVGAAAAASEDHSGTVSQVADEAWEAYLRACEAASPDPVELARWYADFRLSGPEWPEVGLDDVAELLGEEGEAANPRSPSAGQGLPMAPHSIAAMTWGTVELEPEVRDWLEGLPTVLFARAAFYVDLLAEQGPLLGEPHTKQLDGKLRELRFYLDRDSVRITYWVAPLRRIVLLTVFAKTRMRERREVARARRALARCVAKAHTVEEA